MLNLTIQTERSTFLEGGHFSQVIMQYLATVYAPNSDRLQERSWKEGLIYIEHSAKASRDGSPSAMDAVMASIRASSILSASSRLPINFTALP